jgi:peptide methionine sulfoxide reductase MsrB
MEFTWFAGYAWQVGICGNCDAHLGWIFTSDPHRFYGLILERLRFP